MNYPTKRDSSYYINGEKYISITKVLGTVINKPFFRNWHLKFATEFCADNPGCTKDDTRHAFEAYMISTQERGKYIHDIAEEMPEVSELEIDPRYLKYFQALEKWWNKNKPENIATEIEVYSKRLGVAGRLDKYAIIGDVKCLIDFKTSKVSSKDTGLQLAFYKEAMMEMGLGEVDRMMAVYCMETGEDKERAFNDSIEDFEYVLGVYKWMKRKGE